MIKIILYCRKAAISCVLEGEIAPCVHLARRDFYLVDSANTANLKQKDEFCVFCYCRHHVSSICTINQMKIAGGELDECMTRSLLSTYKKVLLSCILK